MKVLKTVLLVGIGYVWGTRAGKERYAQICAGFAKLVHTPVVQSLVKQIQNTVWGHRIEIVNPDVVPTPEEPEIIVEPITDIKE